MTSETLMNVISQDSLLVIGAYGALGAAYLVVVPLVLYFWMNRRWMNCLRMNCFGMKCFWMKCFWMMCFWMKCFWMIFFRMKSVSGINVSG